MRRAHHRDQHHREDKPVGLFQDTPHAFVGGEEASHEAHAKQGGHQCDTKRDGEQSEQQRRPRPVHGVQHRENRPGDEDDLDDAPEQQPLADQEREDRGGEQDRLIVDDERKKRGFPAHREGDKEHQADAGPDHAKRGTFDEAKRHGRIGSGDPHTLTPFPTDGL